MINTSLKIVLYNQLGLLQSLKQVFINVSYHIRVASLTLMRAIRVRLATSICYNTLMKNCFKDWSQSNNNPEDSAVFHQGLQCLSKYPFHRVPV